MRHIRASHSLHKLRLDHHKARQSGAGHPKPMKHIHVKKSKKPAKTWTWWNPPG